MSTRVTGVAGLISSHIVDLLVEKGYQVRIGDMTFWMPVAIVWLLLALVAGSAVAHKESVVEETGSHAKMPVALNLVGRTALEEVAGVRVQDGCGFLVSSGPEGGSEVTAYLGTAPVWEGADVEALEMLP